jgi:Icc-related predicted phosphoesterase
VRLRKSKGSRERAQRIYFATDVHGSDRCFRKFVNAADAYDADVLLLGGDVAGKALVPVRRENGGDGGTLTAEVRGQRVSVPAADRDRLFSEINMLGFYPLEVDGQEIERMAADKEYVESVFRREIITQLEGWCRLAADRLKPEVQCILTPGNDDPVEIDAVLEAAERIECPERTLYDLGPALLASMGDVTPTPWDTEREYSEEELADRIAAMMDNVPADRTSIVNFHNPPYSSGLDTAPELDENLRPVLRGGRPSFIPVGSTAVREAIKKYQPSVGLHGHIHESRGAQKIGRTMCLNPGSEYSADLLRGVIVDLAEDGSCIDFLFTAG